MELQADREIRILGVTMLDLMELGPSHLRSWKRSHPKIKMTIADSETIGLRYRWFMGNLVADLDRNDPDQLKELLNLTYTLKEAMKHIQRATIITDAVRVGDREQYELLQLAHEGNDQRYGKSDWHFLNMNRHV
jgi:hypothetical protein